MTNFTTNDNMCRVEIFKPSGKWLETIAVEFEFDCGLIHDQFRNGVMKSLNGRPFKGCTAVCFDPHHEFAHPLMITI